MGFSFKWHSLKVEWSGRGNQESRDRGWKERRRGWERTMKYKGVETNMARSTTLEHSTWDKPSEFWDKMCLNLKFYIQSKSYILEIPFCLIFGWKDLCVGDLFTVLRRAQGCKSPCMRERATRKDSGPPCFLPSLLPLVCFDCLKAATLVARAGQPVSLIVPNICRWLTFEVSSQWYQRHRQLVIIDGCSQGIGALIPVPIYNEKMAERMTSCPEVWVSFLS